MGNGKRALSALGALLVFGGALHAGADPADTLHKARTKVLAGLSRTRDYTCVETVVRSLYRPLVVTLPKACRLVTRRENPGPLDALHLDSLDRLRLDVTMTQDGETYSWAGASKFEDGGVAAVVQRGPIGSGAFAGFLTAIFSTDVRKFEYVGEQVWNGRDVKRYTFATPLEASHYKMKVENQWVVVAYSGELLVDEKTFDVVQVEIEADDLPEAARACTSSTTLTFDAPGGAGQNLLLPTYARQAYLYATGEQSVNAMEFANCHEYRGDAVITYGEPENVGGGKAVPRAAPRVPVPPGLRFSLELLDGIDSDKAAAGDRFRARLVEDLRDKWRALIARKGSVVEGRVRRVEVLARPREVYLALAPTAILVGSERVRVAANRDWSNEARLARTKGKKGVLIAIPRREEGPAGVFRFDGERAVAKKGFRSDWLTVAVQDPVSGGGR